MRRWGGRVLLGVLLAALLLLGSSGVMAADSASPPTPAAQGIDGLVPPPPNIQQGNQPTLAERYPTTAYTPFTVSVGGSLRDALTNPVQSSANVMFTVWAGTEMEVLLIVAVLTSRLLEWTFSVDVIGAAGGPLTQVVQTLADQVYRPLLETALVLGGLWLVWHLLIRRRTMYSFQGVAWALVAMIAAGVYFAAPVGIMSAANNFSAAASREMLSAIGTGDPKMAGRSSDPSFSQGDGSDAELRIFVDRYWRTYVFKPWSVAAFGDVNTGQRYGEELLAKWAGQPNNFDADFKNAPQSAQDWYGGSRGGDRFAIVAVALVVAVMASILFLLIAGAVVVAQFGLLILLMVAPLFLLVGVHPGTGRRLLVRWAELAAAALLIRVLSAALLALVLVLSGLIAQIPNWGVAAALEVALVITAFIYRKPFLRVFGQVATPRLDFLSDQRAATTVASGTSWVMGKLARQPITAAAATSARAQTAAATAATGSKAAMTGGTATAAATAGTAAMAAAAAEAGKLGRKKALAAVGGAQKLADGFGVSRDSPASQRPANGHRPVAPQVGSPPPAPPERER
ncbi:MAG TPA: type IV secretion system protein [Candidatus Dormibacteraeota bacterium]|nr:type IV secretion system protein [Candidatus Dormibacteraeota bacterium]